MATYERRRYLLMATDPVHIGTGGYRLGRVDNSIVREPGTRLPKIPGTSLHGAIRSYSARIYENLDAAGQDHSKVANPDEDPICYTFGYIRKAKADEASEDESVGYSGVVSIFDAQLLFFPVYSLVGPVWVTTAALLREADFELNDEPADWVQGRNVLLSWPRTDALNLGWLMVEAAGAVSISAPDSWNSTDTWSTLESRIVIVQESMYSQIVNSNLEVRTSVSIDPVQGAAKDGALFTYEALPRGTLLTMEVVIDDYRAGGNNKAFVRSGQGLTARQEGALPGKKWTGPADVVEAGMSALAWRGVGGMGTRGFGRLTTIGQTISNDYGAERSG